MDVSPGKSVLEYGASLRSWSSLAHGDFNLLVTNDRPFPKDYSNMEAGANFMDRNRCFETGKERCNHGQLHEAMCLLSAMCINGVSPPLKTFASLLQECGNFKALWEGRQVHSHLINHGIDTNVLLGNLLINMYIKCENFGDACQWFGKMFARDVFSWTLLITAYAKSGDYEQALGLFWRMNDEGVRPNKVTCLSIIKACTCLLKLEILFAYIVEKKFDYDEFLISNLLDFYAKHTALDDASFLFQKVKKNGVVPWNVMIAGFSRQGLHDQAFALFGQMLHESVTPDEVTYLTLLKLCVNHNRLDEGWKVHALTVENEMESNIVVVNTIIDMYAKCTSIKDAEHMFNTMPRRDIVSWSVMIAGHIQHSHADKALLLFEQMLLSGIEPNNVTYMYAVKACTILQSMRRGQHIHLGIALHHLEHDSCIGSSLINMYLKCGSTEDAHFVFASMPQQDTVLWNSLIDGWTEIGQSREALKMFWHMIHDGFVPDEATFVSSLKACVHLADLEQGRQIHSYVVESSVDFHSQIGNSLVDMYAKCGCLTEVHQLFANMFDRSSFAWMTAIPGCIHNDANDEGLQFFDQMKLERVASSKHTFSAVSNAYRSSLSLDNGSQIDVPIRVLKLDSTSHVRNVLVDMNAKAGSIGFAHQVFGKMLRRDVVSYNTIISINVQNGLYYEAMNVFHQMLAENVKADNITYVSLIKACASLANLEQGMQLHVLATEGGHDRENVLKGILVDMYVKCGCMAHAKNVFDHISERDMLSWTAMVLGYAQHGLGWEAIRLLQQMQKDNVELDEVTFISAFSAFNYGGLVDEGLCCFHIMCQICRMMPSSQHFACLIDLLGRVGRLEDAADFLQRIPCQPAAVMWTALLAACNVHSDLERANYSVACILGLDPGNDTACVTVKV